MLVSWTELSFSSISGQQDHTGNELHFDRTRGKSEQTEKEVTRAGLEPAIV